MKQRSKLEYLGALYGDPKKMTDAELEASLKELRKLSYLLNSNTSGTNTRQRAVR